MHPFYDYDYQLQLRDETAEGCFISVGPRQGDDAQPRGYQPHGHRRVLQQGLGPHPPVKLATLALLATLVHSQHLTLTL